MKRFWLLGGAILAMLVGGLACRAAYFQSVRSRIGTIHREHTTLSISPQMKRDILAGNRNSVQWLEALLLSHRGSIPALILLAPRAGLGMEAIPDFVSGYGTCGNSTESEIVNGLRKRMADLEAAEASAIGHYFSVKRTTPRSYPEIDFNDRESVGTAFLKAIEVRDLPMLYLLFENTEGARKQFWDLFRGQHYNPSMTRSPIRKTSGRYDAYEISHGRGTRVYFESGFPLTFSVADTDKDGDLGISRISFNEFQ